MWTPSLRQNLSLGCSSPGPQQGPGRLGDLALAPKTPMPAQECPQPTARGGHCLDCRILSPPCFVL